MDHTWISLERVAAAWDLTLSEAAEFVERQRWPKVFKTHETLVLVPAARGS